MSVHANSPLMIVDDDDDLRNTLAGIMASQGYQVEAFGDARAALAALEDGRAPFLILLDLMMPGMSGWEFRAAKAENATLARIPVVIVTAANELSDGDHTVADMEILHKPFELDSLFAVVDRYEAAARHP